MGKEQKANNESQSRRAAGELEGQEQTQDQTQESPAILAPPVFQMKGEAQELFGEEKSQGADTAGPIQRQTVAAGQGGDDPTSAPGDSIQENIFSDGKGGVNFDQESMANDFLGSSFQGAGNQSLRDAMIVLYAPASNEALNQALTTVASARSMSVNKARLDYFTALAKQAVGRANYAAHCADKGIEYSDPSPPLEGGLIESFSGSNGQLRFGKILGDVFGIDAVFGSIISPTGGLVGPGNSHPGLRDLDPDNPVSIHGTVHDAGGYLYNCHNMGPGYDYIGDEGVSEEERGNPLTGQSNINWWNEAYREDGREVPWTAEFLGRGSRALTPFVEGEARSEKDYTHMPEAEERLMQIAPQQMLYEMAAHDVAYHLSKSEVPPPVMDALDNNGYRASAEDGMQFFQGALGFRAVLIQPAPGSGKNPLFAIRGTQPDGTREGYETIYTDLDEGAVGTQQFQQNRELIEAILALGGGRVDVTGHSLGGAVSQHVAVNFAGNVANVATFQSPGIDQASIDRFNEIPEDQRPNITHHIVTGDIVDKAGAGNLGGDVFEHDFGLFLNLYQLLEDVQMHYGRVEGAANDLLDIDFMDPAQNLRDYNNLQINFEAFKSFLSTTGSNIGTAHATRVFSASNYADIRQENGIADEAFAGGNASDGNQSATESRLGVFDTHPHQDERGLAEALRNALGPELQKLFHLVWAALDKWEEIKNWVYSAINTADQGIRSFGRGVRDGAQQFGEDVVDGAQQFGEDVVDGAVEFKDDVVEFGQNAGAAVEEGWNAVEQGASDAARSLRNLLPF